LDAAVLATLERVRRDALYARRVLRALARYDRVHARDTRGFIAASAELAAFWHSALQPLRPAARGELLKSLEAAWRIDALDASAADAVGAAAEAHRAALAVVSPNVNTLARQRATTSPPSGDVVNAGPLSVAAPQQTQTPATSALTIARVNFQEATPTPPQAAPGGTAAVGDARDGKAVRARSRSPTKAARRHTAAGTTDPATASSAAGGTWRSHFVRDNHHLEPMQLGPAAYAAHMRVVLRGARALIAYAHMRLRHRARYHANLGYPPLSSSAVQHYYATTGTAPVRDDAPSLPIIVPTGFHVPA
jgi:hypothetical protein